MADDITVTAPRLTNLIALYRLFRHALLTDFTYFPSAYVEEIRRQNNLWHLIVASYKRDRIVVVAERRGCLIGYAIGSLTPRGGGELYWLYVDRSERHARIGGRLLHAAIAVMSKRGAKLITLVTYDLKDYYRHQGFSYRGKQHIHGVDLDVMEYRSDGQKG